MKAKELKVNKEFLKVGDSYQHRDFRRIGQLIKVDGDEVELKCKSTGDIFRVSVVWLQYAPVYKDGRYWLTLSSNYPRDLANAFLMRRDKEDYTRYDCIGSAKLESFGEHKDKWAVEVDAIYDEETESDCLILGHCATQGEALKALWDYRVNIFS